MDRGLEILAKVKRELKVPILTDVHSESEVAAVAAVVDVLQTPAFLSRQTDFIRAVAQSGKPVNIKKGQFLAPHDMKNVIDKARAAAREQGLSYSVFMNGLKKAEIQVDRKVLSDIAVFDKAAFAQFVVQAKASLGIRT